MSRKSGKENRLQDVKRLLGVRLFPADVLQLRTEAERNLCTRRRMERQMQPLVYEWMEDNPVRAAAMSEDEIDELFSMFGVGGPLTLEGVEHFVRMIERKREVYRVVGELMDTHLADVIEGIATSLHGLVQVYPDRR